MSAVVGKRSYIHLRYSIVCTVRHYLEEEGIPCPGLETPKMKREQAKNTWQRGINTLLAETSKREEGRGKREEGREGRARRDDTT